MLEIIQSTEATIIPMQIVTEDIKIFSAQTKKPMFPESQLIATVGDYVDEQGLNLDSRVINGALVIPPVKSRATMLSALLNRGNLSDRYQRIARLSEEIAKSFSKLDLGEVQ